MSRFVLGTEYELEKKEKEGCSRARLSTGLLSSFFLFVFFSAERIECLILQLMPPKKRKRGGQHKLPPALRKAQEAARDAKAAAEAEKAAAESKTEPVSQPRPAMPA